MKKLFIALVFGLLTTITIAQNSKNFEDRCLEEAEIYYDGTQERIILLGCHDGNFIVATISPNGGLVTTWGFSYVIYPEACEGEWLLHN